MQRNRTVWLIERKNKPTENMSLGPKDKLTRQRL